MNPFDSPTATPRTSLKLSGWRLRPLLPNEPCLHLAAAERTLTERYLLPVLSELEVFFLAVRRQLDPELERLQPVKLGKPYPLGQCLEIAQAVEKRLRTVAEAALPAEAAQGLRAFKAFLRAGGSLRQVWGDLRGQYFQNAFQLGSLYVDVSNDTVVPTKPKVEVLPFAVANFIPIRSFTQFRQIATSYWQDEIYPNHVLPELAPHCPLIHVSNNGSIRLHDATQYMLAMTRSDAFRPGEAVLREAPMPQAMFERVRNALQDAGWGLAATPEQGRQQALQQCRTQRAKRWHQDAARPAKIIHEARRINQQLARWHQAASTPPSDQETPMPTIKIDNIEYDLDTLSDDAKAQLQSIQFVDQELAKLQMQVAAMQTARNAYVNALKAALPVVPGGDTIKLS
ncbi:conserved protein of unknown function [Thauera humireducens]|uniref:DUF6447 family protein n=1 Tax=Thauera humireducens TaxID=1134435 RepID=UPI002467A7A0|nr:DUF6447 family protein [Thauera humireducens]CAH1746824.1 conserved protein of unknown function [Thauera humireducens]